MGRSLVSRFSVPFGSEGEHGNSSVSKLKPDGLEKGKSGLNNTLRAKQT